jgi:hypothetical protein
MQIRYHSDDRAYVSEYEVGDFVRLRTNESGDGAMGRAGQWGSIIAVEKGRGAGLVIQVAGYSENRNSALQRLTGIPRSIVVPCDSNGVVMALPARRGLRKKGQQVVVNSPGAGSSSALPAWAAALVVASCTLILVVAAAIASKSFGVM